MDTTDTINQIVALTNQRVMLMNKAHRLSSKRKVSKLRKRAMKITQKIKTLFNTK